MPKEIKETIAPITPEPITPEPVLQAPTIKHHFVAGSIAAGIILALILIIWIFFKVIPAIFSSGTSFVATTLNSTFIPSGSTSSEVSKTTNSTSTTQNDSSSKSTAAPINYYGNADLAISIIGTGIIDPTSKQFVSTNYAGVNNEIAVKFQVKNIGTNVSGPWTLRLNMPSRTTPSYDSYQPSIKPGDGIEYVGSFNSPTNQGLNTGYIIVDPLNALVEPSKNNNDLTVSFNVNGTSYNYNNNYSYGSYGTGINPYYGQTYTWTNINVSCYANPQNAMRGTGVVWYATASGGNGYFSYYWIGDDGLYSTNNSVGHVYFSQGNKYATVAVTSAGQTVTKECSAYIY